MDKNTITSFIFFIMVLLFVGCQSEDCCINIDVGVSIHYQNQDGDNLINSSPEFMESNIRIYYKNGDTFEYVFDGNLDAPNYHSVYESNGDLILTVFASNYYNGNQSTTLIELNETTKDTLLCEFNLENGNEVVTRAWLNGMEMENRFITLKK